MHLLLVDASSFIHRAYHALPKLTRRSDEAPVGAVKGFVDMIWGILRYGPHKDRRMLPTHIGMVFDHPSRNFRHEIYPAYKAGRSEKPHDLVSQFALVRRATEALGLFCLELRGMEADDLIATYAAQAREIDAYVTIASADKDLMCLVDERLCLVDTMRDTIIDYDYVVRKFGVSPAQMVDYLTLVGDPGDNVPGVPSIGAKTAAELLTRFHTLEGILNSLSLIPSLRTRSMLQQYADQARLSKRLVELNYDVAVEVPLFNLKWTGEIDTGVLLEFCDEMEFASVRQKIERALNRAMQGFSNPEPESIR